MRRTAFLLLCCAAFATGARAQVAAPCCSVTAIDTKTGAVSAKVNANGETFQFKVTDAKLIPGLRVGQAVYANFAAKEVSLDGKSMVGLIVSIAPPPGERAPLNKLPLLIPPKGTGGSSSSSSSGSSSSPSTDPFVSADPNCGPSINSGGLANSTPNDFGLAVYLSPLTTPPQLAQNCTLPVGAGSPTVLLFPLRQFTVTAGTAPYVPTWVFLIATPLNSGVGQLHSSGLYVHVGYNPNSPQNFPVPNLSLNPWQVLLPFTESAICGRVPFKIQVNVIGGATTAGPFWGLAGSINVPAC